MTKPADIARGARKYLKTHFKSICFYLVLLFLFFELSRYSYTKADDLVFQNAISRYGSFKNWVIFFGTHWGGRIIPQGILVLLLQTKEKLFHVFEALIWLILLRYVSKNYDPDGHINRKIAILLMAGATLCLIPMSVLSDSIFWKCANVLYLWGTSMTMAALYPMVQMERGRTYHTRDFVFAVPAAIYVSSFEQGAAFLCGAMFFLFLASCIRYRRIDLRCTILLVLSVAFTAVFCVVLPGNRVRTAAETLSSYPNFDMLSFADKLLIGITTAIENSLLQIPVIFVFAALLVLQSALADQHSGKIDRLLSISSALYFIVNAFARIGVQSSGTNTILNDLFQFYNAAGTDFSITGKQVFCLLLAVWNISFVGNGIARIHSGKFDTLAFVTWFGGFAALALMGFSPTIIASGERPRFLAYFLLLCCTFCGAAQSIHMSEPN